MEHQTKLLMEKCWNKEQIALPIVEDESKGSVEWLVNEVCGESIKASSIIGDNRHSNRCTGIWRI